MVPKYHLLCRPLRDGVSEFNMPKGKLSKHKDYVQCARESVGVCCQHNYCIVEVLLFATQAVQEKPKL